MKYIIITPAFNEEDNIADYMQSIIAQSVRPTRFVIVNDHSTDRTGTIARDIAQNHDWITILERHSQPEHRTGSKVAETFLFGLEQGIGLENRKISPDVIVKMDADLVLPDNYFKNVLAHLNHHSKTGICGGVCALPAGDGLKPEKLTDRHHVRGALKAYRMSCYKDIGGIRPVYGWDTLDELLAAYHGWETVVLPDLVVEHRSPTGTDTKPVKLHKMTGELFYRLGYGPIISLIASLKRYPMPPRYFSALWSFIGYIQALLSRPEPYVTRSQRIFIRKLRYRRMWKKFTDSSDPNKSNRHV